MIWARGEVVRDDALRVSVLDRSFEHGLGLFETLRTWNGHATLLPRHLKRMQASARELGLPLDPAQLPDDRAVAGLLEASRHCENPLPSGDVRIRITLSGGLLTASGAASLLWMTAGPLPPAGARSGAVITRSIQVAVDDPLARHKTLNYWRKRIAHAHALEDQSDEVLCITPDRLVCEGTRTNLFLVIGQRLVTPSAQGPLLPGIMRRVVLEWAARIGLDAQEAPVPYDQLFTASEAFLTNSVRGMLPLEKLAGRELPVPGPVTRRLWAKILRWLESGGAAP